MHADIPEIRSIAESSDHQLGGLGCETRQGPCDRSSDPPPLAKGEGHHNNPNRKENPMTIIEDTRVINRPPIDSAPVEQPASAGPSRKRRVLAAGTAIAIAVGLAAVAAETVTSNEDDETRTTSPISDHLVVGVGPHAVYVGPAPEVESDH